MDVLYMYSTLLRHRAIFAATARLVLYKVEFIVYFSHFTGQLKTFLFAVLHAMILSPICMLHATRHP